MSARWAAAFDPALPEGASVVDACCGTGALGIEALSRGAARACFLDQDSGALALVRRNVEALGLEGEADIRRADVLNPPPARLAATLLFLDPPYARALTPPALGALAGRGWLAPGAIGVVEIAATDPFTAPPGFAEHDRRGYGDTMVVFVEWQG